MASLKIGLLTGIVSVIIGGLVVAYAWGLEWVTGIEVVALLLAGLFVSVLIALFLPVGNMMVKAVALCVVFALIVLWGFSYLGVM
jgi:ABC-type multidrug transport system permease subunit